MSRIILGDCLSVLPTLPAGVIDFVLTDPPYLANYRERSGRLVANDQDDAWLAPAFQEVARVMRPDTFCVSFYGWHVVDKFMAAWRAAGLRPVGHIVFAKGYQSTARYLQYRHESAYLLAKGRPTAPAKPLPDVMPWEYTGNRLHPTQKPVSSLTQLIEAFCPEQGIVLDPFAGSGSTCVAADQVGRRFVGVELEARYHQAAVNRLHQVRASRQVSQLRAAA